LRTVTEVTGRAAKVKEVYEILLQVILHPVLGQLTMQVFVITSQMYPGMHWQATPKKPATELGTAEVPQATHVWVISFQIE
jgi:hypothetical protein